MTVRSRIIGCGSYLPANVVTNDDLAKRVDTSDEWIVARTGIRQRHVAAEGETTSDLAVAAFPLNPVWLQRERALRLTRA